LFVGLHAASDCRAREAQYHHVHLTASDPKAAGEWYVKNLGGEARKIGFFNAVGFGKISILFFQLKPGFPGSQGSSVDHIGFAVANLDKKLEELKAAGVEIVSGAEKEGPIRFAFIKDPWGTLIELIEDPTAPGFHHVHLAAVDPQATLDWYRRAFGGEQGRYAGVIPGVRYGDVWVLAKKVAEPQAPTKGRSIDHLGWAFDDLDAAADELKATGEVPFESGPYALGNGKIAFVIAPGGVRIELVGPGSKKK